MLRRLEVLPITHAAGKSIIERYHYLHSYPGGTQLAIGIFLEEKIVGAMALGVGSFNGHALVEGATQRDCLTLSRFWLSDELPKNSASRVLGVLMGMLRRNTSVKFLLTYADPSQGHIGTIYQATNWIYTGMSVPMSLYSIGDGAPKHSRSFSQEYGIRSVRHFSSHGITLTETLQPPKHRYVKFLVPSWRRYLRIPEMTYPKKEERDEDS